VAVTVTIGNSEYRALNLKTIVVVAALVALLGGITLWTWSLHGFPSIGIEHANILIKQYPFCRSRISEVGYLASMFR
jgi:hypothetical protein